MAISPLAAAIEPEPTQKGLILDENRITLYRKLTYKQKKLYRALQIKEYHSLVDLSTDTRISRPTIYKALADPDFSQLLKMDVQEHVLTGLPGVGRSLVEQAHTGSFQHQKLILEMTGLYTDRSEVQIKSLNFHFGKG